MALVDGRLHIRLRSRKNRSQGSIFAWECTCDAFQEPRLCPVHCFNWEEQQVGARLFTLSAAAAKMRLRRYASLCGIPGAQSATLTAFRASRATTLALQGKPLHQVLEAGEWRSAAVLRYVSP